MVVDTSALLAVLFAEPQAERVAQILSAADQPMMSAVNYTECLIRVMDRAPAAAGTLELALAEFALEIVPVDRAMASDAAQARLRYPINLGDCFAYALAKARGMALLTLDADFSKTDVALVALT
ncbi:MAG: type II toxin-antitoxin system VapC family toxin [Lysobacterales bacterium]